ncbi:MAG: RING finger protein [Candidatus Hodarchaeales archaeon]|jgi:hypothetical protein
MTTSVSKLTRLSREKKTGNIILFLATTLGLIFLFNIFSSGMSTFNDQIIILGIIIFSMVFGHVINKSLRQPFFTEVSRYRGELNDRRLDIQQILVSVDMIEPLQLLVKVEPVLKQIQGYNESVSDFLEQSKREKNLSTHPFHSSEVQKLLQIVIDSAEDTLLEIDKKIQNVVVLAKTRNHLFNSINQRINRPQNEVELGYLFYCVKHDLPELMVESSLVLQVIKHALDNGELHGTLKRDEIGEKILVVGDVQVRVDQDSFSWGSMTESQDFCVICRQSVSAHEQKVTCPECRNVFHRTHLLEWLKVFNQCPMCQQRIKMSSR